MPYKDPPKPQISWPVAAVIISLAFMLMASVTLLALKGANVSAILSAIGGLLIVVAGLFGFNLHNKVDRVEQMSNGRLTEQMEENRRLQDQVQKLNQEKQSLALLIPVPDMAPISPAPPAPVETPVQ